MTRNSFKSAPIHLLVGLVGLHQGIYAAVANEHDSALGQGIQSNVAIVDHETRRTLLEASPDDFGTGEPEDYTLPEEEGVFITGDPGQADGDGELPDLTTSPDPISTIAEGPATAPDPIAPTPIDLLPEIGPMAPELAVDPMEPGDAPIDLIDMPVDGPEGDPPLGDFVEEPFGGPEPVEEPLEPVGTELPGPLAPGPEEEEEPIGTTDDSLDGGEVPPGEVESFGVPTGGRSAGMAAAVAAVMAVPLLL